MLLTTLRIVIIGFFLIVSTVHAVVSFQQYRRARVAGFAPSLQPGHEFADLPPFVLGNKKVGYFTDLDLSPENYDTGNFLSAQYQFAPALLDINNSDHTFILIDASSPESAFKISQRLQARPVYFNPYGKLLVQKP